MRLLVLSVPPAPPEATMKPVKQMGGLSAYDGSVKDCLRHIAPACIAEHQPVLWTQERQQRSLDREGTSLFRTKDSRTLWDASSRQAFCIAEADSAGISLYPKHG